MSLPPIINSPLFNSSYFNSSNGYLTLTTGDQRYLRLGGVGTLSALNVIGNMNCGSLTINGSSLDLSGLGYLSGVTPGAASASKALVLDSSSNISGISNLSASSITGTIQTAAQPNITSLGNLTLPASLTISNGTTPISITNTTSSSSFNVTIQNSGGAQDIGSSTAHQVAIRTNATRRLTITAGGNVSIADTASGLQLDLGSTGTGLNVPNLTFRGTTFPDTYYTGVTLGGAAASKAVVLNSTLDYSGLRDLSITRNFIASTSIASPSITCNTITGDNGAGSSILNLSYSTLNINGLTMTADANELNYNDLTTLGTFQSSKTMTLDSSGVGLMPLGTSSTNNLRFYGGTANRETMNIYRVSDTNGLVIASRTTSASNNKTYPLLNLISTDNPSSFVGGVSATSADLFNINWNDKPTVGFTSQTHRFCFNVGNGQPYKSGYPHTYTLATSADAFCINPAGSSPTPSSGCLYLVSDTVNKMLFNTNTPYSSSFGTAPVTLSSGNVYIKASNALNDGTANFDMPIFMKSSNASPIGFGLQLSNATNATSTNSAYFGTTSTNDLVLMTANTRRVTVSSAGRVGIGTGSPSATLHVSGSNSYTVGVGGTSNCYQYNVQGNIWSNLGLGPVSVTVSAIFSSSIFCVQSIYTSSDRRLKENITPISITLDHYDKLEPVSYNWKGETKAKLGLIAQDAMKVCGEMVSIMPNENMKEEGDNDLEGYQYTLDYSQLGALNAAAIKLLIKKVNELEKNT